jgi:hypothetical protein
MPKGNLDFSRIFGEIRRGFIRFAGSYGQAVNGGANVAGKKIMEAVKKSDHPSDIYSRELLSAIQSGVKYAGEQMIKSAMDFVEQIKEKPKKQ